MTRTMITISERALSITISALANALNSLTMNRAERLACGLDPDHAWDCARLALRALERDQPEAFNRLV